MVHRRASFRQALWLLPMLIVLVCATSASAQGLFGAGLPGLPSFGGFLGGTSGCGEKECPRISAPLFYVGWMEDRNGTTFTASTDDIGFIGIQQIRHSYPNRGVWLGLAGSACLWDNLSFLASGWYLIPNNANSREDFEPILGLSRSWHTNTQWWYVDGLFALGPTCGPGTLLLGLRYDYLTTRFKDPPFDVTTAPTDEADVISEAWIPLIGAQYTYQNTTSKLVARVVGFPTLLGRVRYNETLLNVFRIEASGNYNSNGFLEFFTEYSRRFGGADVGLFARWNYVRGTANLDTDFFPGPINQDWKLYLNRSAWTLGGSFTLTF